MPDCAENDRAGRVASEGGRWGNLCRALGSGPRAACADQHGLPASPATAYLKLRGSAPKVRDRARYGNNPYTIRSVRSSLRLTRRTNSGRSGRLGGVSSAQWPDIGGTAWFVAVQVKNRRGGVSNCRYSQVLARNLPLKNTEPQGLYLSEASSNQRDDLC